MILPKKSKAVQAQPEENGRAAAKYKNCGFAHFAPTICILQQPFLILSYRKDRVTVKC